MQLCPPAINRLCRELPNSLPSSPVMLNIGEKKNTPGKKQRFLLLLVVVPFLRRQTFQQDQSREDCPCPTIRLEPWRGQVPAAREARAGSPPTDARPGCLSTHLAENRINADEQHARLSAHQLMLERKVTGED